MAEQANFKRINFFEASSTDETGTRRRPIIWRTSLHNRVLHTPGVVPIAGGGLKVQARGADLSFEVAPATGSTGAATSWCCANPAVKVIEADKLKLRRPSTWR